MSQPSPNPVATGLAGKCPRCGEGRLFSGYLRVAPRCELCGLDLSFADSADGPAVFLMFIVGFAVVGGALFVEFAYEPQWWVHALAWPMLTALLSLALLRPLKGLMIALQFANRAEEGRLDR